EIAHMSQDVALGILRARVAEPRAEAEIDGCRLGDGVALDRNPADQYEAPTVDDLVLELQELSAEGGQRKVGASDLGNVQAAGLDAAHRGFQFFDLLNRKPVDPFVALAHFGADPSRRACDRGMWGIEARGRSRSHRGSPLRRITGSIAFE